MTFHRSTVPHQVGQPAGRGFLVAVAVQRSAKPACSNVGKLRPRSDIRGSCQGFDVAAWCRDALAGAALFLGLAVTAACAPEANTTGEHFYEEHQAASAACESTGLCMVPPLSAIDFVAMSQGELSEWCSETPCVGHAIEELRVVMFDERITLADRCEPIDATGEVAGSIMIHELLHMAGLHHDTMAETAEFDRARAVAWIIYITTQCPEIVSSVKGTP